MKGFISGQSLLWATLLIASSGAWAQSHELAHALGSLKKQDYALQASHHTECLGYWQAMQSLAESGHASARQTLKPYEEMGDFFAGAQFLNAIITAKSAAIVAEIYARDLSPSTDDARALWKKVEPEVLKDAANWRQTYLDTARTSPEEVEAYSDINLFCAMMTLPQMELVNEFRRVNR